ncbi:MAG: bifunctional DNA-formamidopyrimidine glycosylase/DNA-(apurinic or apyrimidinic site) lyase [Elusimicrobia bacterium]|nr:bifunctional DNA-formamidopyrimidine glycosylase/DNA-(apurinic or apyrimidinic site) lyase [Elusimicrobiota bacterium]
MPELPEVETIVRGLKKEIAGRVCLTAQVWTPSVVKGDAGALVAALMGRRVAAIDRHGKAVFVSFAPDGNAAGPTSVLRVHLGMTGQLVFEPADSRAAPHTHAAFRFAGNPRELRYRDIRRFGNLRLLTNRFDPGMGPDAWLSSGDELFSVLSKRRGMIKAALLNQKIVAGLGNIYVDESLYRSGIHPRAVIERLRADRLRALCDAIQVVLGESIALGGTSFRNYIDTEGARGGFKGRLRVYGKQGTRCICGATIQRIVVVSRGTHFCPACQPRPRSKKP